jgi:hypothetical protein
MHVNGPRTIIGLAAAAALVLTGCSGVNNVLGGLGGGKGNARLVVASLTTPQTNISLTADGGTINSGLSASTPIGTYAQVGAGQETFAINTGTGTGNLVSSINVSVASSTNYSIVLEGEPGAPDYLAFGFQDTNALNNAATVRFKVNNAAPNLASAVDVYVWLSTNSIPPTPTVASLGLNQDSGSVANAPGNAYIPQQGSSTLLPAGVYDVAIVPAGTVPNGSTDLFDGATSLVLNTSYSFTIADNNATPNNIAVLESIDEPFQSQNQSVRRRVVVR